MADPVEQFQQDINELARSVVGLSDDEAGSFLALVKHCAKKSGVPAGAAAGIAMAGVGSVTIPGIGAAPGWVVGALAGFASGTAVCTFAHKGVIHPAVRQILSSSNHSVRDLQLETKRLIQTSASRPTSGGTRRA